MSFTDSSKHRLPHSYAMRKWEYGSTPCPTCNMPLTAFLFLTDNELPHQLCSWRWHLPLPAGTCGNPFDNPTPQLFHQRTSQYTEGLQTGALPTTLEPQTTSTTSIMGRLPARLLRDDRIKSQTWIFKTHNIFPTSFGSGTIAKETGAIISVFLCLYWMKHELKTGRWQTVEEYSMEK